MRSSRVYNKPSQYRKPYTFQIAPIEAIIRWMTPFNYAHPFVSAGLQLALFGGGLYGVIAWMLSTLHP